MVSVCMCVCGKCMSAGSYRTTCGSWLFYHTGPRGQTQVTGLGGLHFYPMVSQHPRPTFSDRNRKTAQFKPNQNRVPLGTV